MSSQSTQPLEQPKSTVEKPYTTQFLFKYVNLFLISILAFCIKGFLNYRDFCISKEMHVVSVEAFIWVAVGFLTVLTTKFTWGYLMTAKMDKILHPKYEGQERVRKHRTMLKLSHDTVVYAAFTVLAYSLFRDEYWFPSMVGGRGSCSQIYREYPKTPSNSTANLQMYLLVQLGIHFYSLFEMVVFKKSEPKFYELVMHHTVAASLILFALLSNQIAAGSIILIVHDASDILLSLARYYVETAGCIKMITGIIYTGMLLVWIWLRIIAYPICLLANVYINRPREHDQWMMISFQYNYLLYMAVVLYAMHIFWTYFMIKIGMKSYNKKSFVNVHDKKSKS